MRFAAGAWSTTVEAWAEFRVYRARVLMSIIGVAVAIMALTAVAAVSAVAEQSVVESSERSGGRPAMLSVSPPYSASGALAGSASATAFTAEVAAEAKRYGIDYWSRSGSYSASVRGPDGAVQLNLATVDVDYGTMFRVRLSSGSWFGEHDALRLTPAVVIDTGFWKLLGEPDLRGHPVVKLVSPISTDAVVIGVTPGGNEQYPSAIVLQDAFDRLLTPDARAQLGGGLGYDLWVPPAEADAFVARFARDLTAAAGDGMQVSVNRQDYQAYLGPDPLLFVKIVGGASSGLILLLGALGLLNISLVTVRARIREIGIRRSFGATAARVFVGVMMESVVATAVAGTVGVMAAILALKNPLVDGFLHDAGLQDIPAFPLSAALTGLLVAVGVGALAGLIPALVAVRVKPIDAIRY